MQEETKKCPYCYSEIPAQAVKCSFCGEWLNTEDLSKSCGIGFKNPVVIVLAVIVAVCFCVMLFNTHNPDVLTTFLFILLIFGVGGYLYLLPSIIAISKKHPQTLSIVIVNIIFGETLIGWIVALIWANSHRIGRNTHW